MIGLDIMSTDASQPTELYNSTADATIGGLLLLCIGFGVPANLAACYYFLNRKARTANAIFFNRVYTVISCVDCLVCGLLFPIIQVLFSTSREHGLLFQNPLFCNAWSVVWITLLQSSVFLVAVLSVARLCVLSNPSRQLSPSVVTVLTTVSCLVTGVGLCVCPLLLKYTTAIFFPTGVCVIIGNAEGFDYANASTVPAELVRNEVVLNTAWFCILGFPMFPIAATFAISLALLKRASTRSETVHGSTLLHKRASTTVFIVTSIYIVCNLPTVLVLVAIVYYQYSAGFLAPTADISHAEFDKAYQIAPDPMLNNYIHLCVLSVFVPLNSTLNPVIYFWRMHGFRGFVCRGREDAYVTAARLRNHPVTERSSME